MNDGMGQIWSFLDSDTTEKTDHDKVAEHNGYKVRSFDELTDAIAKLNFYNPHLNLYYRGQTYDHKITRPKEKEKTQLLPTAFRDDISPNERKSAEYLTDILPKMAVDLMEQLKNLPSYKSIKPKQPRQMIKRLDDFQERKWSILQHYGCPTPLLDVTQSLQVASWFATHEYPTGNPAKIGYIYVLGLPNIHGHISYFPCDGMVMIKLQSACPPEAKRPHYQEGYLVGSIPHTPQAYSYRQRDVALRLVAKFRIENPDEFWQGVQNDRLSLKTLFPEDDQIQRVVGKIKRSVFDTFVKSLS